MSIGKPKNDPIDLNGLMNEIENDHRITVESDAIDKHIEELRGKHSKKCTFYTLRFGCSFAAVNTIKPQLL